MRLCALASCAPVIFTLDAMARVGPYLKVIVELFAATLRGNRGSVHIRPVSGQAFPPDRLVECSRKMVDTSQFPVGTKFVIWAKETDRQGGPPFLYSNPRDPIVVVSDAEAAKIIEESIR